MTGEGATVLLNVSYEHLERFAFFREYEGVRWCMIMDKCWNDKLSFFLGNLKEACFSVYKKSIG
jgi:hypothetical protein